MTQLAKDNEWRWLGADCQTDAAINDDFALPSAQLQLFIRGGFQLERGWIGQNGN